MVSLSLGADPRDFALFAFGGAGPLHAAALARELAIPRVLVPSRPGITNAIGCVVADLRHDFVTTVNKPLDSLVTGDLDDIFDAQTLQGERLIKQERVEITEMRRVHSVDMQFVGQTHLLRVDLEHPDVTIEELGALFEAAYFKRFKVQLSEIRANLVNVNTSLIGARPPLDLTTLIDPAGRRASTQEARTGTRQVRFDGIALETPVYWRDHLPLEAALAGPAVIEQMDTTIVIGPGDTAWGDMQGNIVIGVGT